MWIVFITAIIAFIIWLFATAKPEDQGNVFCKKITDSRSIEDVVSSIGWGRVYPFYTGMSIDAAEKLVEHYTENIEDFKSSLFFAKMTNFFSHVTLAKPEYPGIEEVNAHLAADGNISCLSIKLNELGTLMPAYMCLSKKFGTPLSNSSEFAIWRNRYMVINLDYSDNSINIIDERFF